MHSRLHNIRNHLMLNCRRRLIKLWVSALASMRGGWLRNRALVPHPALCPVQEVWSRRQESASNVQAFGLRVCALLTRVQ